VAYSPVIQFNLQVGFLVNHLIPLLANQQPQLLDSLHQLSVNLQLQLLDNPLHQLLAKLHPQLLANLYPQLLANLDPQLLANLHPQLLANLQTQHLANLLYRLVHSLHRLLEQALLSVSHHRYSLNDRKCCIIVISFIFANFLLVLNIKYLRLIPDNNYKP